MDEDMQNADAQPADEGSSSREGRSWQSTCPQDMLPAPGIIHIQPCRTPQDRHCIIASQLCQEETPRIWTFHVFLDSHSCCCRNVLLCDCSSSSCNIMLVPREQRTVSTFTSRHAKRWKTCVCQNDTESTVCFGCDHLAVTSRQHVIRICKQTKCLAFSQVDV